jgi:hypothetical protein
VVQRILEAMKAGNVEAFKKHGAEALLARYEEDPQAAGRLQMFPRMLGEATFSDPEVSLDGDHADVTVTTQVDRGGSKMDLTFRFDMVKEGGVWKCAGFGMKR